MDGLGLDFVVFSNLNDSLKNRMMMQYITMYICQGWSCITSSAAQHWISISAAYIASH